jgi:hypothetical protein
MLNIQSRTPIIKVSQGCLEHVFRGYSTGGTQQGVKHMGSCFVLSMGCLVCTQQGVKHMGSCFVLSMGCLVCTQRGVPRVICRDQHVSCQNILRKRTIAMLIPRTHSVYTPYTCQNTRIIVNVAWVVLCGSLGSPKSLIQKSLRRHLYDGIFI